MARRLVLVGAFVGVVASSVAVGAAVSGQLAQGYPGVQNPGQPLHGAKLECMSPPKAARYLAAHGFVNVVWQIESGALDDRTGGGSVQRSSPPEHGYVVPGAILSDGMLYMIVDQRRGTTGTGACPDMRMP